MSFVIHTSFVRYSILMLISSNLVIWKQTDVIKIERQFYHNTHNSSVHIMHIMLSHLSLFYSCSLLPSIFCLIMSDDSFVFPYSVSVWLIIWFKVAIFYYFACLHDNKGVRSGASCDRVCGGSVQSEILLDFEGWYGEWWVTKCLITYI